MATPIKQTCRTILFESFNPLASRLDFLLTRKNIEDMTNLYNLVSEKLEVSSYSEFLEKFEPEIYETQTNNNGKIEFLYSFEKIDGVQPTKISNHPFYNMIIDMYDNKGKCGKTNDKFQPDEIQSVLTPDAAMKKAQNIRLELDYNFREYLKLSEKGAPQSELDPYIERVNELRGEIIDTYDKDNFLVMLPLALDMVDKKIESANKYIEKLPDKKEGASIKCIPCNLTFDSEGNVVAEEISVTEYDTELVASNQPLSLQTIIENDFDEYSKNGSEFTKRMVLSAYTGAGTSIISSEELKKYNEQRDMYSSLYKKALESFVDTVAPVVEKLLNVRAFFDHASRNSMINSGKVKLIVANCQIEDLMSDDAKKSNFRLYMNQVGLSEINENRLWFSIVPALYSKKFSDIEVKKNNVDNANNPFGSLNRGKKEEKTPNGLSSFAKFNDFMEIMSESNIVTFFNFKANYETSFEKLNEQMVKSYKNEVESITQNASMAKYSVFCYPNFTVQPKNQSRVKIGHTFDSEKGQNIPVYVETTGVYIESSYIACAMTIATQDPEYLKKNSFNITQDIPAVRFDFESSFQNSSNENIECGKKIVTNINPQNTPARFISTEEEINKDGGFGFCFACGEAYLKSVKIQNCYVYTSRLLEKEEIKIDDERTEYRYRPIYKTLVNKFLENYCKLDSDGFKNDINSWKRDRTKNYINNPLRNGISETDQESIDFDGKEITVHYGLSQDKINPKVKEK